MFFNFIKKKTKYYLSLIRINEPTGFFLLLWPTLWSLFLSEKRMPNLSLVLIFALETLIIRSAGCVFNDIIDRNIDAHISRTKNRPLAAKKVSLIEAITIFVFLILLSYLILLNYFHAFTIFFAVLALILILIYPFSKRYIYFPQIILGITFSFSVLIVFQEVTNSIYYYRCFLLFILNTFWVLIYDTQYSLMDKNEDIFIGVKSTSLYFGKSCNLLIFLLQLLMITTLFFIGYCENLNFFYYFFLLILILIFKIQYDLINKNINYLLAFKVNNLIGIVILISFILGIY